MKMNAAQDQQNVHKGHIASTQMATSPVSAHVHMDMKLSERDAKVCLISKSSRHKFSWLLYVPKMKPSYFD